MKKTTTFPAVGMALALLAGCGDSGTGPDPDPGGGNGNGDTRQIVADPSFGTVVQEIFNRKGCASGSCHGTGASAGLDLRTGNSYAQLVNVTATQSAVARVIPGNADGSYLIIKVEGRQTVGQQMPIGGSALDNIDLTNLKNWINQGAKNN
jgi:hypothetical protein